MFGGYDIVAPVKFVGDDRSTPFFLYSDSRRGARGWIHIRVEEPTGESAELSNRLLKTTPPDMIRSFPFVCYVDGNVKVQKPVDDLFAEFLESGADLGFFQHSDRKDLRQELDACHKQGKIDESVGSAQIDQYEREGFEGQVPLLEGSFFFRKNNRRTQQMMAVWSREIQTWVTRDQLSLPYSIWKTGAKLHIFAGSPRRMYSKFIYTAHGGKSLRDLLLRSGALTVATFPSALEKTAQIWRNFRRINISDDTA